MLTKINILHAKMYAYMLFLNLNRVLNMVYLIFCREEVETPKVWVQICLQRMVELAKESTTMRLILDPMFNYFDMGQHWVARHGLAMTVLSDMSYYMEYLGKFFIYVLLTFN